MTAEVTPEGLFNHNVWTMMWHYTARWMFGTGTRVGVRWGVRIPPRRRVGFPIVKCRQSAPSRVLFDGKFHQAVAG